MCDNVIPMPGRRNLSISLTPELADYLAHCVTSGRYQTSSEVVREALRLLQHRDALREAELERARGKISSGRAQADAGDLVDREEFLRGWDEDVAALDERERPAAG